MPTYILEGAAQATLSQHALTLSMSVDGPETPAKLEAVAHGHLLTDVVRPRPGLMIIPRIDSVTTVRVVPIGLERFPPGTIVTVSVAVNNGQTAEPERAELIPVDLAGLTSRDLFVFERTDENIRVRAARVLPPPADLGPLGNAARIAATEILGVQAVDTGVAVNMVAALDGSASFARLVEDGSADAVLNVLAGVSEVIAAGKDLQGAIVGTTVTPVHVGGVSKFVDTLHQASVNRARSIGLRSGADDLHGAALTGPTVTYVITDAVPADVAEFELSARSAGRTRHLVVLGTTSAWRLQTAPRAPHTFLELARPGQSLADSLLANPHTLRSLVASLMTDCFPPGSSEFERVTP